MGDLILNPSHADCLYLKNLLLKDPRAKGRLSRPLKFACNYSGGCTTRDRMSFETVAEEHKRRYTIWQDALSSALHTNPHLHARLTSEIVNLLTTEIFTYSDADTFWFYVEDPTATII